MGLDFSYLLYFKRDQLWQALEGLTTIAEPHHPPTMIHFPEGERAVPLASWSSQGRPLSCDDPELQFSTSLYFEVDDEIADYLDRLYRGRNDPDRSPPLEEDSGRVAIGYIYLTVYTDLSRVTSRETSRDLILFDFGTTGTHMSLLFSSSPSIRSTLTGLLERADGLCGIFNMEDGGGELFWLEGRRLSDCYTDAYLSAREISDLGKSLRAD